jgi:hypothetical protein
MRKESKPAKSAQIKVFAKYISPLHTTTISFSHKQVRYLSYTHMSKKNRGKRAIKNQTEKR